MIRIIDIESGSHPTLMVLLVDIESGSQHTMLMLLFWCRKWIIAWNVLSLAQCLNCTSINIIFLFFDGMVKGEIIKTVFSLNFSLFYKKDFIRESHNIQSLRHWHNACGCALHTLFHPTIVSDLPFRLASASKVGNSHPT